MKIDNKMKRIIFKKIRNIKQIMLIFICFSNYIKQKHKNIKKTKFTIETTLSSEIKLSKTHTHTNKMLPQLSENIILQVRKSRVNLFDIFVFVFSEHRSLQFRRVLKESYE